MPSDSGDMKLLGNFSKLIEFVSVNPDYNPANPSVKIPAPNTQKAAALAAVANVGARETPYKSAVNDGQDAAVAPLSVARGVRAINCST